MPSDCPFNTDSENEKGFFRSKFFWKPFLGIVLGGLAGYLFYYFIGSELGSFSMMSNARASIILGCLVGFWIAGATCKRFRP
ncbi:MAG: hypothetical protein GXY51_02765 [Bacteroidetes bacterium]|jgi:LytS/YehU family sensor histidine kinase|nr:hypothetical protein [Bacteroidota bacterium]